MIWLSVISISITLYILTSMVLNGLVYRKLRYSIIAIKNMIKNDNYDKEKKYFFENLLSNKVYNNGLIYFLYPWFTIFAIILSMLIYPFLPSSMKTRQNKNNSDFILNRLTQEEKYLYVTLEVLPIIKSPLGFIMLFIIYAIYSFIINVKVLLQSNYKHGRIENKEYPLFEIFSSRVRFL